MYAYRGSAVCYQFLTQVFGFSREMQWSNKKPLKKAAQLAIEKKKGGGCERCERCMRLRSPSPHHRVRLPADKAHQSAPKNSHIDTFSAQKSDMDKHLATQTQPQSPTDKNEVSRAEPTDKNEVSRAEQQFQPSKATEKPIVQQSENSETLSIHEETAPPSLLSATQSGKKLFLVVKGDQCTDEEPFWVARTHRITRKGNRIAKLMVHWYTKTDADSYRSRYKPCFVLGTPTPWIDTIALTSVITTFDSLVDGKLDGATCDRVREQLPSFK